MSLLHEFNIAFKALAQTISDFLPNGLTHSLPQAKRTPNSKYHDLSKNIELACQIQLLKNSTLDKRPLNSRARIEAFSCTCAIWILCFDAKGKFEESHAPLSDEAEDLLYVAKNLVSLNNIKESFVSLFENAKTTSPNESIILSKEIIDSLQNCFKDKNKKAKFLEKPFYTIEQMLKALPSLGRFNTQGGAA